MLRFIQEALCAARCVVLSSGPPSRAPFRLSFETPEGERWGLVVYAFSIRQRRHRQRARARYRIAVGYGRRAGEEHDLWQDPAGLSTTLLLGIDPVRRFFVGADPVLHSPTRFGSSIGFGQDAVDEILARGWHAWERVRRPQDEGPIEVLVGAGASSFLDYVRFEREALGEDQGHRHLLAERMLARGLTE